MIRVYEYSHIYIYIYHHHLYMNISIKVCMCKFLCVCAWCRVIVHGIMYVLICVYPHTFVYIFNCIVIDRLYCWSLLFMYNNFLWICSANFGITWTWRWNWTFYLPHPVMRELSCRQIGISCSAPKRTFLKLRYHLWVQRGISHSVIKICLVRC